MRLCFVTNGVISGHATMKRAFGMARPLAEAGHSVSIILEDHPENRDRLAACGGCAQGLYVPQGLGLRAHLSAKRMLVSGGDFDVVHSCGLGFRNLISRKAAPNAIRIMDHVELESSLAGQSFARATQMRLLETYSLYGYDWHVAASRYLHAVLHHRSASSMPRRRFLYLPYASEHDALQVPGARPLDYAGRRVALYMGGLFRGYGVWDLLDAAEQLRASHPELLFALLGKGPEESALRAAIASRGLGASVVMQGYVADAELPAHLAAADLFLAPLQDTVTDWARCPSKLLTYMSYGRPVVTGPVGEALEYLGGQGCFYRGGAEALATAIKQALTHTADTIRYPVEISWESRVRSYLSWLEDRT